MQVLMITYNISYLPFTSGDFAYIHTLRDAASPYSRIRLHTKVKMANYIFIGIKLGNNLSNFSHVYTTNCTNLVYR